MQFVCPGPDDRLFERVFELGESQSDSLGMLTREAWREYAVKGHIMAAVLGTPDQTDTSRLVGYCAFRLPRNEVVLAHLVVAPDARHQKIARALVHELSRRYQDRRGIAARCRRDYEANDMWPHLGFVAQGDRPGRSAKGYPLTSWWLDHGHPDLMTWQGAPASLTSVVMDANVFFDLHAKAPGTEARVTRLLLNEVLDGRIQLLATPELHNEIDRRDDAAVRRTNHALLGTYPSLAINQADLDAKNQALIAALGRTPRRAQDLSDLKHIAYAAAAGVQVVVTRDNPALRKLQDLAADAVGVKLVSPEELVALIDEVEAAPSYWPAALLGTGYQVEEAGADDITRLNEFFDSGTGEKKKDFERRLRRLASQRPSSHRLLYSDPAGNLVALLGTTPAQGVLEVSLLRMRPSALQPTLAAQLVSRLRPMAREASVSAMRATDPHPHPLLAEALLADGFRPGPQGAVALTLTALCTVEEVAGLVARAGSQLSADEQGSLSGSLVIGSNLDQQESPEWSSAVERQLRPLRIVDAPLGVWLVPIKPVYASALFGYPVELFTRPEELGISVEHVYYRGGSAAEKAPGRVVWYVSGKHHGFVVGCSELAEVVDGTPTELYSRFRRLGVYKREAVMGAAGTRGRARALRVINTEMFDTPLPLKRLKMLAARRSQSLQLWSASRIGTGLFADIMREVRGDG